MKADPSGADDMVLRKYGRRATSGVRPLARPIRRPSMATHVAGWFSGAMGGALAFSVLTGGLAALVWFVGGRW